MKRKLGPRWIGPYKVIQRISDNAYKLQLPVGCDIHDVFNTASLKLAVEPLMVTGAIPVTLADKSVGFVVNLICGKRTCRGGDNRGNLGTTFSSHERLNGM